MLVVLWELELCEFLENDKEIPNIERGLEEKKMYGTRV